MSSDKDFRILDEYVLPPKAPPPSDEYFKYVKPSLQESDAKLEYDMDEEDFAWLELMNEQRRQSGLEEVSFGQFEGLMDRLEKECFFHCTSRNFKPLPPELEHQADCAVCLEGWSSGNNAILFCDMCCLSVHQTCYGVLHVPDDIWLCRRCLYSPSAPANCCLCACKSGALKQSLDGRWCHVTCAIFTPEVSFGDALCREPVLSLDLAISSGRGKLLCGVCGLEGRGVCLKCQHMDCKQAYHATCAQLMDLSMKVEYVSEMDGSVNKRVSTFCDTHSKQSMPVSSLSTPPTIINPYASSDEDAVDGGGEDAVRMSQPKDTKLCNDNSSWSRAGRQLSWKGRLKQVRKVLSLWTEMEQPTFVPVLTIDSINHLVKRAEDMRVSKCETMVTRLHCYWTLKRQSRAGRPLINSRKYGEGIQILNINKHLTTKNENNKAEPKQQLSEDEAIQQNSKRTANKKKENDEEDDDDERDDMEEDDKEEDDDYKGNELMNKAISNDQNKRSLRRCVKRSRRKRTIYKNEESGDEDDGWEKNEEDDNKVEDNEENDDGDIGMKVETKVGVEDVEKRQEEGGVNLGARKGEVDWVRQSQVLRRGLEKVRLLIELVRKREKMKMEQIKVEEKLFEFEKLAGKVNWVGEKVGVVGGEVGVVGEELGVFCEKVGGVGEKVGMVGEEVGVVGEKGSRVGEQVDVVGEKVGEVGEREGEVEGSGGAFAVSHVSIGFHQVASRTRKSKRGDKALLRKSTRPKRQRKGREGGDDNDAFKTVTSFQHFIDDNSDGLNESFSTYRNREGGDEVENEDRLGGVVKLDSLPPSSSLLSSDSEEEIGEFDDEEDVMRSDINDGGDEDGKAEDHMDNSEVLDLVWVLSTCPFPAMLIDKNTRTTIKTPKQAETHAQTKGPTHTPTERMTSPHMHQPPEDSDLQARLFANKDLRVVVMLDRNYSRKCVSVTKLARLGVNEEEDRRRMDGVKDEKKRGKVLGAYRRSRLVMRFIADGKDVEKCLKKRGLEKGTAEKLSPHLPPQPPFKDHSHLLNLLHLFKHQKISEDSFQTTIPSIQPATSIYVAS